VTSTDEDLRTGAQFDRQPRACQVLGTVDALNGDQLIINDVYQAVQAQLAAGDSRRDGRPPAGTGSELTG
jgi:hypothetical protein